MGDYKVGDTVVLKNGNVIDNLVLVENCLIDDAIFTHKIMYFINEHDGYHIDDIASHYYVPFPFFKKWLVRINPIFEFLECEKGTIEYPEFVKKDILTDNLIDTVSMLDDSIRYPQIKPLLKMPKYQRYLLGWVFYFYLKLKG